MASPFKQACLFSFGGLPEKTKADQKPVCAKQDLLRMAKPFFFCFPVSFKQAARGRS